MENNRNPISWRLYQRYYVSDGTPEDLISSHWKHCHKETEVRFFDKEIKSLSGGPGFGSYRLHLLKTQIYTYMTIGSYLCKLRNKKRLLKIMQVAVPLAKRMGLDFSYDCFRQVCTLSLIMDNINKRDGRINVINIGDGYGFLSALIKEVFPNSLICLVDLGKSLLLQAHYCGKIHPGYSHHLLLGSRLNAGEHANADFLYCPAEYLEGLNGLSFDLAINIASMQEMNKNSIDLYFDFLRRNMVKNNLFYCCNREEKKMPRGEISGFFSYPWVEKDVHLIDDQCPWHRYFLSLHKKKTGTRFLNFRIAFVKYFDGIHRHRLSVLHTRD